MSPRTRQDTPDSTIGDARPDRYASRAWLAWKARLEADFGPLGERDLRLLRAAYRHGYTRGYGVAYRAPGGNRRQLTRE